MMDLGICYLRSNLRT